MEEAEQKKEIEILFKSLNEIQLIKFLNLIEDDIEIKKTVMAKLEIMQI